MVGKHGEIICGGDSDMDRSSDKQRAKERAAGPVNDGITYRNESGEITAAVVCIQNRRRALWLKLSWIE